MNTFEYHYRQFNDFENKLLSWKPDFIIPVAKKGCKMLKASNKFGKINSSLIRYRTFFQLHNINLKGKRVSIVDDATQYTATLQEYRTYFESLGAEVRTYSFVGHEQLSEGKRWMYDEKAEIEIYLPNPVYQEYILQQSYFLLENGNQYDLDHLIIEMDLPNEKFESFLSTVKTMGLLIDLEDYFLNGKTKRFSLINPSFFNNIPYFSDESVSKGEILKIKFIYNPDTGKLYFSPLIFPSWNYKVSSLNDKSFKNLPFIFPFNIPTNIDIRNHSLLLQIYYNIQYIFMASFGKSFLQEISKSFNVCDTLKIKRDDLDAVLGTEITTKFTKSLKDFFCNGNTYNFGKIVPSKSLLKNKKIEFQNFSHVINYLKKGYEKLCKKNNKRLGVHYYLTYENLFKAFSDVVFLNENLDYYCDFGVIVPETIIRGGKIQRACRTGEPNPDYNWSRTQVLIPLVIQQYKNEFNKNAIEPMLLNKLLSNFTYDFPSEFYHELHCLIGEPYTFGTIVKCYHHHRARSKPSIYSSNSISPYFEWKKGRKEFITVNPQGHPKIAERIKDLFDERQEISYSEIITYFKFLLKIYKYFRQHVDVLNMLSICREENYYYSHVLYNIRTWIEKYGNYLDMQVKNRLVYLHASGIQANSAYDKIILAKNSETNLREIEKKFELDFDFLKSVEKLLKNHFPFSNKFKITFKHLEEIVLLELLLTNLSLWYEKKGAKYKKRLLEFDFINYFLKYNITIPNDLKFKDFNQYKELIKKIYGGIITLVDSLPREEQPLLSTRLKISEYNRARNIATEYVYKNKLLQAIILFMDFTGLRTIPEPKATIISEFYKIVRASADQRDAIKLYGGKDGDDAFSYIFYDIRPALECAKDIKEKFESNLFLSPQGDIKFGICAMNLPEKGKETNIIQCWGLAKDCCEFKGVNFRNKGNLVISKETHDFLISKNLKEILNKFSKIEDEFLKNNLKSSIYIFNEIFPIEN